MPRNAAADESVLDWNDLNVEGGQTDDFGSTPIDFSTIEPESDEFPILPEGDYPGRVESCRFKYAQSSGNPMLEFEYVFTDPSTGVTVRVWDFALLTLDQRARTLKKMNALDPNFPKPFIPVQHASHFNGIEVWGKLAQETSEERGRRNRLRRIVSSSGMSGL